MIPKFSSKRLIHLYLFEKSRKRFDALCLNIENFKTSNPQAESYIDVHILHGDCNDTCKKQIEDISATSKNPMFIFVDPTGIKIRKDTLEDILNLSNPKDLLINYILEGVRRSSGVARKIQEKQEVTKGEISTAETLNSFIGTDINFLLQRDVEILREYVTSMYSKRNLNVVAYDIKYPDRNDILYYLLFASKKNTITKIIEDVYARQKEKRLGETLFGGKDYYKENLLCFPS